MKTALIIILALIIVSCSNDTDGESSKNKSENKNAETHAVSKPLSADIMFCLKNVAEGEHCEESSVFDFLEGAYIYILFNNKTSADGFSVELTELDVMDYSRKNTNTIEIDLTDDGKHGVYKMDPEVASTYEVSVLDANGNKIANDTITFFGTGDEM